MRESELSSAMPLASLAGLALSVFIYGLEGQ